MNHNELPAIPHVYVHFVYLQDGPKIDTESPGASLSTVPRVGDFFQRPYGRGKRYVVKAVVFEADEDASSIYVELAVAQ